MVVDLKSINSPQVKLIDKWDQAFVDRNLDLVAKFVHKDFRRVVHPRSLGKPPLNRDEWLEKVAESFSSPTKWSQETQTYHSIVESPGKVVLHCTFKADGLHAEGEEDESIWIMHFADEDGSLKVKEVEQFAHSSNPAEVL